MTEGGYADKIAKLLAKAESTSSTHEAEALVEKAQAWMTKYAIDEAMIAAAGGGELVQKIVQEDVVFTGVYAQTYFNIGKAIAKANECRVLYGKKKDGVHLTLIGFEEDVKRVLMMNSSLQIQAVGARVRWEQEHRLEMGTMSGNQKFKSRRGFLFGFAQGLDLKLERASQAGRAEATNAEAERTHTSTTEASDSVELVLRNKKQRVEDWIDETYGSLSSVSRSYSMGSGSSHAAGHAAGLRADIGGGTVGKGGGGQLGQ